MGIKRYILFATVAIIALGLYVYSFEGGSYNLQIIGIPVTLPIAVWVVVPLIIFTLLTILHMMFYSMKSYMSSRALGKDYDAFIESSKARLLNQEFEPKFKTQWYKMPSDMLKAISNPEEGAKKLDEEKLRAICADVSSVEKGEFVDLKQYKLKSDNPLVIKNEFNRLKSNPKVASEILRSCSKLESPLCKEAFGALLLHASYTEIKKFDYPLSSEDVLTLLRRHGDENDDLYMNEDDVRILLENAPFDKDEYIEAARLLKRDMNPDSLVAIYEKIFHNKNEAGKGYLYVLFEFQMLDRAREILQSSDEEEYQEFKSYLYLRDNGQNASLKTFL